MALEDVLLPKTYRNGEVLFEQDLDAWRIKAEEQFNVTNLNLTQIVKDCFSAGYQLDCDGLPNLGVSLQDRIVAFESGGGNIIGTTSPTWIINTDDISATLDTSLLTSNQNYFFPDCSGTFLLVECVQDVTGAKTFNEDALLLRSVSAGAGVLTFNYENTATDRVHTIPVSTLDDVFVLNDNIATLTNKTLTAPTITDFTNANHDHSSVAQGGNLSLDASSITSGILPVIRGGTGVNTSTGTGSVVLSNTPTLTTPTIGSFINANHNHSDAVNGGQISSSGIDLTDSYTWTGTHTFTSGPIVPFIDPPTTFQEVSARRMLGGSFIYNLATSSLGLSYNVSSVTKNGTGDFTVFWDLNFSIPSIPGRPSVGASNNDNHFLSFVINVLNDRTNFFSRSSGGVLTDTTNNSAVVAN